jgi:hypothetical protein
MVCESITKDYEKNFLGLDAALLNTKNELCSVTRGKNDFSEQYRGQIGYFFGRSSRSFPLLKVLKLINRFSDRLDRKVLHLPWSQFSGGQFSSKFDFIFQVLGKRRRLIKNDSFQNGDIILALSKCSLIITDTYHVAINAIALGVPVVMIPEFNPSRDRDANMGYVESWRDKRVLLFQSNYLNDLMVLPGLLGNKDYIQKKIDLIEYIVNNPKAIDALYKPIWDKAIYERGQIGDFLTSLVRQND